MLNACAAPQPLEWKLDAPLRETIFRARVEFSTFAQSLQVQVSQCRDVAATQICSPVSLQVVEVTEFGEDALRKLSLAPDAFVQTAFQTAWYRLKVRGSSLWRRVR